MSDLHGGSAPQQDLTPAPQQDFASTGYTAGIPAQAGRGPQQDFAPTGYTAAIPAQAGPAPVSAPGYETYAMPAYAQPAPRRGRAGTIVLSIATGVLTLATAAFGVLYFLEADARADTQAQLDQKTSALSTEEGKSKDLGAQLATSKEESAKLNQDLTGAKAKTDEVAKARDALAECFRAIETFARSKTSANAKVADEKCAEAEKHY